MQQIEFQRNDEIGEKTLDIISEADKFNEWIYKTISPYCKGDVMEIGSGLGNISKYFLFDNASIMLSDIRQEYCEKLYENFSCYSNLLGVKNIDLTDTDFDLISKNYLNSFDTVFSINVIEHIHDDNIAILNCFKLLKTGGNLIIMVPAYQNLYNVFDKSLGHYRRYTLKSIGDKLVKNNFSLIHKQYFNFIGIFGWFISGRIQKNNNIPKNQMKLYNRFVPIFKIVDFLIFRSFGLSAIVVGRKYE